jgi:hypothetical protein
MERCITEEQTTKAILNWLELNDWKIICFDFPQSGTGVCLHPNENIRIGKSKGAFIPDIVAIKNEIVVFFENKDRFVLSDFVKVQNLRENNDYLNSIEKLLTGFRYSQIFYGVGVVFSINAEQKTNEHKGKIDFIVFCHTDKLIQLFYDPNEIFK